MGEYIRAALAQLQFDAWRVVGVRVHGFGLCHATVSRTCAAPRLGRRGRCSPSHSTLRSGPYTAVRWLRFSSCSGPGALPDCRTPSPVPPYAPSANRTLQSSLWKGWASGQARPSRPTRPVPRNALRRRGRPNSHQGATQQVRPSIGHLAGGLIGKQEVRGGEFLEMQTGLVLGGVGPAPHQAPGVIHFCHPRRDSSLPRTPIAALNSSRKRLQS